MSGYLVFIFFFSGTHPVCTTKIVFFTGDVCLTCDLKNGENHRLSDRPRIFLLGKYDDIIIGFNRDI